jgi:hypothetical protein
MTTNPATTFPPGPYTYCRGKDGCDDTWDIYDAAQDRPMVSIPFWDEPGTEDWVARSEALARLFTAAPTMLDALRSCFRVIHYEINSCIMGENEHLVSDDLYDAYYKAKAALAQVVGDPDPAAST